MSEYLKWCPICTPEGKDCQKHKETVNMELECETCGSTNYKIEFINFEALKDEQSDDAPINLE